jgi:glycosyltransferase involved in cell wall biosynthesis
LDKYLNEGKGPEIIIVDSSDDPIPGLNTYQYYRIANNGPSFARNYGAEKSTKEWLVFCDADDFVNPFIFKMLKDLDATGFDAIFFNWKKAEDVHIAAEADAYYKSVQPVSFTVEKLDDPVSFLQNFYPVHAVLLKQALLQRLQFNESQWFIEDVRFYIELALLPGIQLGKCNCENFISFHRYFNSRISLSTSNAGQFWEGVCSNYNYLYRNTTLNLVQKIRFIRVFMLTYHSVPYQIQQLLKHRCATILESYGLFAQALFLPVIFKFARGINRLFR